MVINKDLKKVLKHKYFYGGLAVLALGVTLNTISMLMLYKIRNSLPVLSDLILDSLPLFKWAYIFNIFSLATIAFFPI